MCREKAESTVSYWQGAVLSPMDTTSIKCSSSTHWKDWKQSEEKNTSGTEALKTLSYENKINEKQEDYFLQQKEKVASVMNLKLVYRTFFWDQTEKKSYKNMKVCHTHGWVVTLIAEGGEQNFVMSWDGSVLTGPAQTLSQGFACWSNKSCLEHQREQIEVWIIIKMSNNNKHLDRLVLLTRTLLNSLLALQLSCSSVYE